MADKEAKLKVKIQGEGFDDYSKKVEKAKKSTDKLSASAKATSDKLNTGFGKAIAAIGLLKLPSAIKGITNEFNSLIKLAQKGTAIMEENNLFFNQLTNVSDEYKALGGAADAYYQKAINYQKDLNKYTSLNQVSTMKTQGSFFQLFNAQGVGEDISYQLSESLSNATIDLSSLFNIDYDTMLTKLRSGIIGNSRPLRELGVDVTEGSMQGVLDSLGIEETVDQLSFAEKEIIRYMTILKQVGFAQGDFANTFNTAANQIRAFQSQVETVGQKIAAVFNVLFKDVITFARGVVMAIDSIVSALGSLFGVDWSDTGSTKALSGISEDIDDISSGIGGATKQAKEFKKQLMGFDEINNITPPSQPSGSGGGGGGGGVGSGVSADFLSKIKLDDWVSNFSKIEDSAKKIKKDIMKWLGYTVDENGEIVDLQLHTKELQLRFEKLWEKIKIALGIGVVIKFIEKIKEAWGVFKTTWLGGKINANIVTPILTGFQSLGSWLSTGFYTAFDDAKKSGAGFFKSVKAGFGGMKEGAAGAMNDVKVQTGLATAAMTSAFVALGVLMKNSFENFDRNVMSLKGTIDKETAETSKNFFTWCASVTHEVQKFGGGVSAQFLEGKDKAIELASAIHEDLKKSFEEVQTSYSTKLSETLPLQQQWNEKLAEQIDENGKIKDGHTQLAQSYIEELNQMDGVNLEIKDNELYYNGEKVNSREALKTKIDEVIAKLKEEAEQEANIELYKEAVKNRISVGHDLDEAEKMLAIAKQNRNNEDIAKYTELVDKLKGEKTKWSQTEKYYNDEVLKDTEIKAGKISNSLISHATITKDDVEKALKENKDNVHTAFDELEHYNQVKLLQMYGDTDEDLDKMSEEWKKFSKHSPEVFEIAMGKMDKDQMKHLLTMLAQTGEMTPAIKQGFITLASDSTDAFDEVMSGLSPEMKESLSDVTKAVDEWKGGNSDALENAAKSNAQKYIDEFDDGFQISSPSKVMKQKGEYVIQGLKEGINSSYYQNQTTQALKNYCKRLLNAAKETMQIASPSKVTKQMGVFLMQGFEVGIEDEADTTQSVLQDKMEDLKDTLSQVSEYTADSLLIDTNSMIDYGNVEGKIDAKIDTSGLTKAVAMAVVQGMNQANVNVNIEATTDTGVVIKQVSEAMNDYVNQTGQLPFAIPM